MGPTADPIARAQKAVTTTTRLIEDAQMRRSALFQTLALSQRILVRKPGFIWGAAEDGFATDPLRGYVRKRLQTGDLPAPTAALWAGSGTGKLCVVCGKVIRMTEVEYELEHEGESLSAHLPCFFLWKEEAGSGTESEADGHAT